jgi:ubiquinone/menaquinone biosynthesis C-methylase UbiE
MRETRSLAGKFYPYNADQECYILLKSSDHDRGRDEFKFPVPPQELWEGYGMTAEHFLNSGKVDVDKMKKILDSSGFRVQDGNRVLDLGCASGRMIRWLDEVAGRCEVWGVDISAHHIIWCQEQLSPPFNFVTVTTMPHLPFEDGYFDLIYCGSVFTHISDLADAWLLELKRIMRPGENATSLSTTGTPWT